MTVVLVCVVLALVALVAFLVLKPKPKPVPPPAVRRDAAPARRATMPEKPPASVQRKDAPPALQPRSAPVPPTAAAPAPALVPREHAATMPAELAELIQVDDIHLLRADQLTPLRHRALMDELRQIPPPSRSLHKLVSPDFLAKASSADLSELVMGEPVVAARVVAAVNSPLYGLQQPVSSIGQAVTFLGLNSVRGICLQYMLDDSFKPADPALKRYFDTLWRASAVASELCLLLAQKLQMAEAGSMATQLVLSFLGQFASASLMRQHGVTTLPAAGLIERTRSEQEQLGLSASEIGFLMMQEWKLPPSIIEDVRAIDRILVTPADALDAQRGARLALCYLSARLGERIAQGALKDLSAFDPAQEDGADFHCLQSHLAQPALARLAERVRSPEVARILERALEAARP